MSNEKYKMQEGDAIIFFRFVEGALTVGIGGDADEPTTDCAYECADVYMRYLSEDHEDDLMYMTPEGEC